MKTRSVLFIMICMAVINANAQTFMSKDDRDVSFQSQSQEYFNSSQTMRPVSNYEGTIYTPFGANAPSDSSDVNPNNNNAGGGPGSIRKGFITGPDTPPAEQFPVGEPWVLLVMASVMAGVIAIKKRLNKVNTKR